MEGLESIGLTKIIQLERQEKALTQMMSGKFSSESQMMTSSLLGSTQSTLDLSGWLSKSLQWPRLQLDLQFSQEMEFEVKTT